MTGQRENSALFERTAANGDAVISIWKYGVLISLTAAVLWFVYLLISPARIPGGDIICFKDPGINLARGQGLVSRMDPANPTLEFEVYSNYPPLFPVVYGGFVRIFGIGPKVDELFDFIIAACAGVLFWLFITPRVGNRRAAVFAFISLGLILLVLPVGPFWTQRERPDTLAFCLILCSIASLRIRPRRVGFLIAGLIAGLNWCLSPYGFLLNTVGLALFGFDQISDDLFGGNFRRAINDVGTGALGALLPVAFLLIVSAIIAPSALTRFLSNASGRSTGGDAGLGYFLRLLHGDVRHFLSAFGRYDSIRYKTMGMHLAATFLVTSVFVVWNVRGLATVTARLIAAAIALSALIPTILFPYQPCYMSFTAAVVVALIARYAYIKSWRTLRAQQVALLSLALIVLLAGAFLGRELALTWKAAPSHQRMDQIIASLEPAKDSPPPLVASAASAYFSFKNRRFEVVNLASLRRPQDVVQIDYFALATLFDNPGPNQVYFSGWNDLNLDLIHRGRVDYKSPFLNPRFSYTWECSVYRQRKDGSSTRSESADEIRLFRQASAQ